MTTQQLAHRALGWRCRDHQPPLRLMLYDVALWRCAACGRFVTECDARHDAYPVSRSQLRRRRRDALVAAAGEAYDGTSVSGRSFIDRDTLRAAVQRYHSRKQIAEALDVQPGSVYRAAKRFGITLPRE